MLMQGKDWTKERLLILPFDHRGTFLKKMFNVKDRDTFTPDETKKVERYKWIVYQGFLKALARGVAKEEAGILVDEQFGDAVLRDARRHGVIVALTCEKTGQEEFDFEHGERFGDHIRKYRPDLAKVLVRYNVEGDAEMNRRQAGRLKRMGAFLAKERIAYLFELLVPATKEQLARVGNDHARFDAELRPGLMVAAIRELHERGVEPDVWKLEGVDAVADAQALVAAAQEGGRKAGIITLGRGASVEAVERWLRTGSGVAGTIGFAVGRTIFWDALVAFDAGKITDDEAAERIAQTYLHFVRVWRGG